MQQSDNYNEFTQDSMLYNQDEINQVSDKNQNTKMNRIFNIVEQVKSRAFPLLNLFSFIVKIFINILAGSTTIIGGANNAIISDRYPSLFTPAGYAFSIWGLIYTFNALFVLVQLPYVITGWKNVLIFDQIGLLYAVACSINVLWIFLFNFDQIIASAFIIALFWVVLLVIYIRLNIGYGESDRNRIVKGDRKIQWWEFLIVQPTFSLYLSWLTVATIANSFLAGVKDPLGMGQENYTAMMITMTTVISMIFLLWRKDFIFSGVVCWAVVAIYNKQRNNNTVVATAALINSSLVGIATFSMIFYLLSQLLLDFTRWAVQKYNEKYSKEIKLPF
jgi:translocator protein